MAKGVLTYGMVGGGEGAFIGDVHRKVIAFDNKAELVAGCFSSDPDNSLRTGKSLGLEEARIYKDFSLMAEEEQNRPDGIDFVVIVTPNYTHYPIAKEFLEKGIHVVCDKPLTVTLEQAEELKKVAIDNELLFCVTYTYTGYPLVKHARSMIRGGDLGEIRFVNVEYPQDWLSTLLEKTGQKQASWRADPAKTGPTNCVGDVGTHVENMVRYLTGMRIGRLSARLDTLVEGRTLEDNATIMVDYESGAKGIYWCSQIAVGSDNGLRVRVFGSKGSIEWSQENPNYLKVSWLDQPTQVISRGRDPLAPAADSFSRIPAGHPEGYYEAFANVYKTFLAALSKTRAGLPLAKEDTDYPTVDHGLEGVRFIEKCVESSNNDAAWVTW